MCPKIPTEKEKVMHALRRLQFFSAFPHSACFGLETTRRQKKELIGQLKAAM